MKKSWKILRSTLILSGLLTALLILLEASFFQELRSWVVSFSVFSFLAGRREYTSNVILGILAGAVTMIIPNIIEYRSERKQFLVDMVDFFRKDIFSATENLEQETIEDIQALAGTGIVDKLGAFVKEYEKSFKGYEKRYSKEHPYEKSPLPWRVADFLSIISNHYTLRLLLHKKILVLEACIAIDEGNPVEVNSEESIASTEQFWLDCGYNEHRARNQAKSMLRLEKQSMDLEQAYYEQAEKNNQELAKRKAQQEGLLANRRFYQGLSIMRNRIWNDLCQNPESELETKLRRYQ